MDITYLLPLQEIDLIDVGLGLQTLRGKVKNHANHPNTSALADTFPPVAFSMAFAVLAVGRVFPL